MMDEQFDLDACLKSLIRFYGVEGAFQAVEELACFNRTGRLPLHRLFVEWVGFDQEASLVARHRNKHSRPGGAVVTNLE